MEPISILFILTSHNVIDGTKEPTGVWMEELTTPYYALVDKGYEVNISSIQGGAIPIDPRSIADSENQPLSVKRFLTDKVAQQSAEYSLSIENVNVSDYDAVFLPGGHGTMFDLPESKQLASVVSSFYASGKVVAAVCHGPAGLVNATLNDGSPLVKGKKVSAFTNSEEEAAGFLDKMPFLLEDRLTALGATIVSAPNFQSHAIADGNLITGQNPQSSLDVATLLISALEQQHLSVSEF